MTPGFHLDEYCDRIGYDGPRAATLQTLADVQLHHAQAIPFENLNPFLGWPVRLDAQSLHTKLVRQGRGGYCFEHNLLLSQALTAMGFHVTGLAARVMWNAPEHVVTPRGHMLLLVDVDDVAYIVDVGFGGMTPTAPLRLEAGVEQPTPHESLRLQRRAETFVLEANADGNWKPLYRFDLQEQFQADYEVTNWYLSSHPQSHFVTGLIAARPALGLRYALRGTVFSIHYVEGNTERRMLATSEELRAALEGPFQIALPESPELDAALERLASAGRHAALTVA
jgi:N-hydroxyarylamine O-acetyltransferase